MRCFKCNLVNEPVIGFVKVDGIYLFVCRSCRYDVVKARPMKGIINNEIEKKFVPLYKNRTKNIELRHISKLQEIINNNKTLGLGSGNYVIANQGRLKEKLYDEDNNELGTITINGYQIIKNPFIDITENITKGVKGLTDKYYQDMIVQNNFSRENWNWIQDNWDWLKEHFKDEPEILVLKIEKFEGKEKNNEKILKMNF